MSGTTGPETSPEIRKALAAYVVAASELDALGGDHRWLMVQKTEAALYAAIADWHRREMEGEWTLGTRDREIAEGLNDG